MGLGVGLIIFNYFIFKLCNSYVYGFKIFFVFGRKRKFYRKIFWFFIMVFFIIYIILVNLNDSFL